jgi:very-short-patch-repair endonuclease
LASRQRKRLKKTTWHQDKEKDLKRQQGLEEDGWKFIRYKDEVPIPEQLKEDIEKILKENEK